MLNTKIDHLRKLIIDEALTIENMLDLSFMGYINKDPHKLEQVFTYGTMMNNIENDIDEFCNDLIALHKPGCRNLRIILASLKINMQLHRMGDLTLNIAKSYIFLLSKSLYPPIIKLANLAKNTKNMLQQSISSYVYEDIDLAKIVENKDNLIDKMHDHIFRLLIENMKVTVEIALHINRISKNYERIADLSTIIAQNTIYMCEGSIIRHPAKFKNISCDNN